MLSRTNAVLSVLIGLLILTTGGLSVSEAKTIVLTDASPNTIQNAINVASSGDTVKLPAGTFVIDSTVIVNKPLTIQGDGTENTILKGTGSAHFDIKANNVVIKSMSLKGLPQGSGAVEDKGIYIGDQRDFVISDMYFQDLGGAAVYVKGANATGVVAESTFINNFRSEINSLGYGVVVYGGGSTNWNRPLELGTENSVFVEDNFFSGNRHAVASSNGSRFVFRYNEVEKAPGNWQAIDTHGLEYGSPYGSRSFEIYGNTVRNGGTWTGIWIRGGDGVIFDNNINGATIGILLTNTSGSGGQYSYPAKNQTQELYAWGNTSSGVPVGVEVRPGHEHLFQEERDYFHKEMPGYEPFTYPHPLRDKVEAAATDQPQTEQVYFWPELAPEEGQLAIKTTELPGVNKAVKQLTVEVDGSVQATYPGSTLPDVITFDTRELQNGNHQLAVETQDNEGNVARVFAAFRTDNWVKIVDAFSKPVVSAWLGTIDSSKVSEASAGWGYADVPADLFGDDGRRVRTSREPEFLVWEAPRLHSITLTLYVAKEQILQIPALVVLTTSPNNKDWQDLNFTVSTSDLEQGNWIKATLTGDVVQPTNWLKLTLGAAADSEVIQIGELTLQGRK